MKFNNIIIKMYDKEKYEKIPLCIRTHYTTMPVYIILYSKIIQTKIEMHLSQRFSTKINEVS